MKEPIKPIHRSYRSLNLHSYKSSNSQINAKNYQLIPYKEKKQVWFAPSNQTSQTSPSSPVTLPIQTNITNIYLLIQSCSVCDSRDYTICKYVCVNSHAHSRQTFLPTTRPGIYLDNLSNIVSSLTVQINPSTILNVYWLKQIDTHDIFSYKICYIQIPINLTLLKFSHLINGKNFYYKFVQTLYNQPNGKLLELPVEKLNETNELLECFTKIDLNS